MLSWWKTFSFVCLHYLVELNDTNWIQNTFRERKHKIGYIIITIYEVPPFSSNIGVQKACGLSNPEVESKHKMSSSSTRVEDSVEELVELLLEHRGGLELQRAVLQLAPRNREVVSNVGAREFVNRLNSFSRLFQTCEVKSKVMVKLDVPLEFCPQAEEKAGCADKKCYRLHLCRFFLKESCKFGDKCKRSHNYGDEHTMRILHHFRLSFLNSTLLQKILKIIVDESEMERAASGRSLPDICKFYNKGACTKDEKCPYLHVCEHFIEGDCKFGEGCKRKHDFSDLHNRRVLKQYDMVKISELKVLQRLKGRERKRTLSASSDGKTPAC